MMTISITELSKKYNEVQALDRISLNINAGMFGLLGPNGAGKSSLMRTVCTLQSADSGSIKYNGQNIFENKIEYRKVLGYLPQAFDVYPKETAHSLLNYIGLLKGIASKKQRSMAVDKVLTLTNLSDVKKKRVSTFSGGMKQRFGIAQLLLNEPKVIIVDEPTAGLDPAERTRFLNVLRNISLDNVVIFSTHLVEDVKDLCHDMAILNNGKLLSQIDPRSALKELRGKIWEVSAEHINQVFNSTHQIKLSDHYNVENKLIHRVFSEKRPSEKYLSLVPKLEDFYFLLLNKCSDEK